MSMIKLVRLLTGGAIIAGTVVALKALGDKFEEMEKDAMDEAQKKFDNEQGRVFGNAESNVQTKSKENSNFDELNSLVGEIATSSKASGKLDSKIVDIKEAAASARNAKKKSEEKVVEDKKPVATPAPEKKVTLTKKSTTNTAATAKKKPAVKNVSKAKSPKSVKETDNKVDSPKV